MQFLDAMEILADGGKVKRPDWPDGTYLESPEGRASPGGIMLCNADGSVHFMDSDTYTTDVQADDWEDVA